MADEQTNDQDETVRVDVDSITDPQLDELAFLVVKKLRESMRQEQDRRGIY